MHRILSSLAIAVGFLIVGCAGVTDGPGAGNDAQTHLAEIVETGSLRVGMSGEQAPLNLRTPEGEWLGIEVAIVRKLATTLGVELELVQLPFSRLLPAVEAGDIDMAMSGITITPKRNTSVTFVGPYFVSGKSILTRKQVLQANPNPAQVNSSGFRLAVLAGSTSEEFARTALPNAQIRATQTLAEAVQMVIGKQVDALMADYETCSLAQLRNPDAGLAVLEDRMTVEPIGIALRRGDTQLANLLQNYLGALRLEGELDRIYQLWLGNDAWLDGQTTARDRRLSIASARPGRGRSR